MWCLVVEGSSEEHSAGMLVNTGLTVTKYVPQLLVAFDVLPDNVNSKDLENATTDYNDSYLALQKSVYSKHCYSM